MEGQTLREYFTDAIKYWEPRRILYNLVLAVIVVSHFAASWPASRKDLQLNSALLLVALAVLANVAYCAAYPVDIFAQASGFRERWRELRWVLLGIGLVFASILTHFWSYGLFAD